MSAAIEFCVPGKLIGVNLHLADTRRKTPEAIEFINRVAAYGVIARRRQGHETITGPVYAEFWPIFRDNRPDLEGWLKPTLDALQVPNAKARRVGCGILQNDHQVEELHIHRKQINPDRPGLSIRVTPLSPR
jgi:Holliday junction resolvase RusA-like endonuclease